MMMLVLPSEEELRAELKRLNVLQLLRGNA